MEVYKVKYRNILSVLLVSVLCVSAGFAVGNQEKEENNILTVYAYDSFVSEWGPGPIVVPMFEEATGIKVNLVSVGNGGELLTKLELEKNSPKADVVIGISHELLSKTLSSDLFIPYESPVLEEIPLSIQFDETYSLLPFNYASYSFNYDSESLSVIPTSLDDLLDPMYKKSIIIMDPRTSSVGMGLLEWTVMVYGENYLDWWRAIKENILTIADGWSSGYGLFTEGEAPIVLSYITSPVYHLMYEESDRYKSTAFSGGNYVALEGVGIVKSSRHIENAKRFVDFLLTDAQPSIAIANIMYPANKNTPLPPEFEKIEEPVALLSLDHDIINTSRDTWIKEWVEVMSK